MPEQLLDTAATAPAGAPLLASLVIPARNEAGNMAPLIADIERMAEGFGALEVIVVSDGSTDGTDAELTRLMATRPWLRALRHEHSCGQSAAIRTGARAAGSRVIVTLDGDGQNDPAFVPALVRALVDGGPALGLAQGQRVGRKDTASKRYQSKIANAVRRAVLRDDTRDTGCGLKAFPRELYLTLPYFDALHRFMPALVRREGFEVRLVDVLDRPRFTGQSNYGIWDRMWVGMLDLAGVWWLIRRRRPSPVVTEVPGHAG
jgi:glycosyltransferase involved in cell wall biosynthesis